MEHYGVQTAAGHLTVPAESKEPYAAEVLAQLHEDAAQVVARYPQPRSALLPLLHLVQSVDGYVTGRGIDFCAEVLDLSTAEVSGVATFYTQYKRHPNGEFTVGVCTNTLCAIMGGDQIWDEVSERLGIGHDETTPDGKITLERVECNAACDYAPVVMANWEFFDNQTPESTKQLVDDLRAGKDVTPSRGPSRVCSFKQVSRVLAGFHDGLADEGVGAGPASLEGLRLARDNDWTAPGPTAKARTRPRTSTSRRRRPTRRRRDGIPPRTPPRTRRTTSPVTHRARSSTRRTGRTSDEHHADPDPHEVLGRPPVLDPRDVREERGLPGAEEGARHEARRPRPDDQGLRPARSWWRRLPDRHEVGLPASAGRRSPLPRRQRRRVRAGHLQGHPADDGGAPVPHRGGRDHVVRDRVQPRVHLPARRGRARLPPAAEGRRGGVCRGLPR